jgi:hypothetical protein
VLVPKLARMGNVRQTVQIDFGVGDAVTAQSVRPFTK